MDKELFNPKTIKRFCAKIKLTTKHRTAAKSWLYLLDEGKLKKEKLNYFRFGQFILKDLLGYDITAMSFEEGYIEFSFKNKEGRLVLGIEAKGTATKDLFAEQKGYKDIQKTPVDQLWTYMGKLNLDYGIATNYKDFVLIDRSKGSSTYHFFDFEEIRNNDEKLKEFIAIFSKEQIIDNNFIEKLEEASAIEERNFTKEFYKLFHETRLMLIKEFQENNISKEKSIHFAQLFLNRLMFVFFAEDTDKLEKRLFEERTISGLKTEGLLNDQSTIISSVILDLFRSLDQGSTTPRKIFGFNGGLFKEIISKTVCFKDFRDKKFFGDIHQRSNLKKEPELDGISKPIFDRYQNKLNPIIKNLLIMASFDFNTEVNVNILGHIFEQSITDLEKLKEGEITKRKKEGIYYTPEYITDYISRNTIIPYLSKKDAKTPRELILEYQENIKELEEKFLNIKILDPACGSGAFLIRAIDILLEVHKEIQLFKQNRGEYTSTKKGKKISKKEIGKNLILLKWNEEDEAREIIEKNIFGVDINEESVEITRLSLFLKIAKKNKKLIDLSKNIKWGNSLINDKAVDPKAFDWNKEFPFKFDIIIGNPPWGAKLSKEEKDHIKKLGFKDISLNTAYLFIEKSFNLLNDKKYLGFIIPKGLSYVPNLKFMRKYLIDTCQINSIIDTSEAFRESGVELEAMIIICQKLLDSKSMYTTTGFVVDNKFITNKIKKDLVINEEKFGIWVTNKNKDIIKKILNNSIRLGEICISRRGICINKYVSKDVKGEIVLGGKNISRYAVIFLSYADSKYIKKEFDWQRKEKIILQEIVGRYGKPLFGNYRRVKLNATYDQGGDFYTLDTVVNLFDFDPNYDIRYILCIINSRLESWFFHLYQTAFSQLTLHSGNENSRDLPIFPATEKQQRLFIEKADLMLEFNREFYNKKNIFINRLKENLDLKKISKKMNSFFKLNFNEFKNELSKNKVKLSLKQQDEWEDYFNNYKKELLKLKIKIDETDGEINKRIYDLYGLTKNEIKIIEGSLGN